ncbi:hypothetical protein KJ068_28130, partial [bacterium]|nr:hypothetical protein [bacterium]
PQYTNILLKIKVFYAPSSMCASRQVVAAIGMKRFVVIDTGANLFLSLVNFDYKDTMSKVKRNLRSGHEKDNVLSRISLHSGCKSVLWPGRVLDRLYPPH